MSKVIQNKGGIGMGAPYDIPGYEYDPVTDKFKDLATGKVFSKEYVAPGSGSGGSGTSSVALEANKEISITTNGEIEITPTSGKDAMEKVTANVAVSVPVLEDNKAATIDVSAYTEPVEITPTQGKDGMKKNTITLSNIPSGGSATAYAWSGSDAANYYFDCDTSPSDLSEFNQQKTLNIIGTVITVTSVPTVADFEKISDTEFRVLLAGNVVITFSRDATKDLVLW